MKPSEILYKAAGLIAKDGWCKHDSRSAVGEHCIAGAIREVMNGNAYDNSISDDVRPVLRGVFAALLGDPQSLVDFNNNECVLGNDAVAFLQIAADIASAEGN